MKRLNLKQTAEYLLENDNYLILCHRFPDGDTIGSGFALCRGLLQKGKRARVICSDLIPSKYDYLFSDIQPEDFTPKIIVAVDVADEQLLGASLQEEYGGKIQLCIDHHLSNTGYAEKLLLDGDAAAAGEVVWQLLKKMGVTPDLKMAEAVYTAISTDTGCFRYRNTSPSVLRLAADLMGMGIDTATINKLMFETKSRARIEIERQLLAGLEYWFDGKVAVMHLTADTIEKTGACEGDLENIAPIPIRIEGVQIGITLRENEGGFKVSIRTAPGISACDICKNFGGGGHYAAAGCTINAELDMAKIELKQVVERYV